MLDVRKPAGRCFFLLGWALRDCKRIDYPIHRMKPADLQSTAYHEAGHTIVALYYGCKVDEVRLHNPLEGVAYTGGHSMGWFMDETFPAEGEMLDLMYKDIERECHILLAGYLAEAILLRSFAMGQRKK